MHPLAEELNRIIAENNPAVARLLSPRGRRLFFPKGILSQSAEAKEKAHRANATIGIATDGREPLYLKCIHKHFRDVPPAEIYPYAPSTGRRDLREAWLAKLLEENPRLAGKPLSLPVVTSGLTHGLSVVGDLFAGEDDVILAPDKFWGNYRLIFEVRLGARMATFPHYDAAGGFNVEALGNALRARPADSKTIVLLNFPNNPTGYAPTHEEVERLTATLVAAAAERDILAVFDDAYFGLFYEKECCTESAFAPACDGARRLLCVKADAATKEEFVWGFRCGFLTFGLRDGTKALYEALEKKVAGAVRGSVSNVALIAQTLILRALKDPAFRGEQQAARAVLARRAQRVREVAPRPAYRDAWDVHPFNAGYFMCLRLKGVDAEALRIHLLDRYQVGTIATSAEDLRVAFSSVPMEQIEEVFEVIAKGVRELRKA